MTDHWYKVTTTPFIAHVLGAWASTVVAYAVAVYLVAEVERALSRKSPARMSSWLVILLLLTTTPVATAAVLFIIDARRALRKCLPHLVAFLRESHSDDDDAPTEFIDHGVPAGPIPAADGGAARSDSPIPGLSRQKRRHDLRVRPGRAERTD